MERSEASVELESEWFEKTVWKECVGDWLGAVWYDEFTDEEYDDKELFRGESCRNVNEELV